MKFQSTSHFSWTDAPSVSKTFLFGVDTIGRCEISNDIFICFLPPDGELQQRFFEDILKGLLKEFLELFPRGIVRAYGYQIFNYDKCPLGKGSKKN